MEEPESIPLDSEDVREQLEQQRTLAAQLREKLEQDELQLASKEQKNELLKSKLSLLKSRSKSKRSNASNEIDERKLKTAKDHSDNVHQDTKLVGRKQGSSSTSKGKINILREQLEQNRLRFERHGLELSEDTRSMEAMVEQLRHELEERNVTIEQLQAGQLPAGTHSSEVTIEPVDVNIQLLKKEKEVQTLSAQVVDLQNVILELQENLKEKDCVIEARTQAISLLSEDMSKKWRANVDMLEETRQQMQMMQENFIRIEAGLNAEIEQLTSQLENNSKKLSQAEQNVKAAEAAHKDLASQNSELLAELSTLREAPKTSSGLEEAKLKIDELSQALTEANKLTVKLKAEYKTKVKALNKQIESLRKESDLSGEVVQLQNHIAELEDEKGNLQLHLIEIEESTATQQQTIQSLQETISELKNEKVIAEMKLLDLEDRQSYNEKIEQEVQDLRSKLEDANSAISEFRELSTGKTVCILEKELEETKSVLKEWQCRCEQLEKQLEERSDDMFAIVSVEGGNSIAPNESPPHLEETLHHETLKQKVKILEESMSEKLAQVQELEAIVKVGLQKVDSYESFIGSEKVCQNCETLKQLLNEQELNIAELSSSAAKSKEENEALKSSAIPNEVVSVAPEQLVVEDVSDTNKQLIEVAGQLELKREECDRLENKLKAQAEKTKKLAVNLKVKTVAAKELEERISKYEALIQSNKEELEKVFQEKQDILEKWQIEVSEKDAVLSQSAESLAMKEVEINSLHQQLSNRSVIIDNLESKLAEMQAQLEEVQFELKNKCTTIEQLKQDLADQGQQVDSGKISELSNEIVILQNQLVAENEEKQAAISKLENFTKQAKLKLAKEKKVRSDMIEKQKELETLLEEKSHALASLQEIQTKESQLFHQEKENYESLLRDHQVQVSILHDQLEQERSKLQYASESVSIEEPIEITQDLQPLPSLESFQNEIEDLCASAGVTGFGDILPVLEEEKVKTLQDLSTSFESLHEQLVNRLQNRPDVQGDRKLFVELRNLVTRVINRTTALEYKIKKIVTESDAMIQRRLNDAETGVQTLEAALSEARAMIDFKDSERMNFEDGINKLNEEKLELSKQLQEESQKSNHLETAVRETYEQINALTQSSILIQEKLNEKENSLEDLQATYQTLIAQSDQSQHDLQNVYQQNSDLKLNLEKLFQECEVLRSNLLQSEQEVQNTNLKLSEEAAQRENVTLRCESLQQQLSDLVQQCNDVKVQYEKSTEEIGELQQKLSSAMYSITQLQQELALKEDTFTQQSTAWANEKNQLESNVSYLTQELQRSHDEAVRNVNILPTQENSELIESLHHQLAEKTGEIENYQRRLIQLQMGVPSHSAQLFELPCENQNASDVFQKLENVPLEGAILSQSDDASNTSLINDAFKPAASFFETPSDTSELQAQIQNLTDQLNMLSTDKTDIEAENFQLHAKLESLTEEIDKTKKELGSARSAVSALESKIPKLSAASHLKIEQEKINSVSLETDLKALQWKLENETYEKEKIESELKALAQKYADERPSIPQSLDTHVSTLQDSGAGFNNEGSTNSSEESKTDESLMESNITQLESELGGMVMSQREKSKQKKSAETLATEIKELKEKLASVEAEKENALSRVKELQTVSSESAASKSSTDKTQFGVGDVLMNDDDSWEWGTDTAQLEVQHQQEKCQMQDLSAESVKDLQETIDLLKVENEALEKDKLQLSEDLRASQIRAAKLTRKLKELKTKYDEVSDKSRSTDSPFDILDQAIEEERMKQMQSLEKELRDLQADLSGVKTERDRLQKQIEVFSSANERMVETKERQDVEVEMWQKRSKDLTNQVQALEWKVRELEESRDESSRTSTDQSVATEMPSSPPETLNAVEIDQLLKENHTWNANYENLMQEYQKLRAQCLADSEQRTQVDALVTQQKGVIERLEHEKTYFQDVYDSLKMDYESACAQLASKEAGHVANSELFTKQIEDLQVKLENAEKQLQETVTQLQIVSSGNAEIQAQSCQVNNEREELLRQLEESQIKLEANNQEIERLHGKINAIEENVSFTSNIHQVDPVQETFVSQAAPLQEFSANTAAFNWGNVVAGGTESSNDVFESIANNTTQALEEQLALKESELQKEKRMIETLKRSMEESEQEWGQLIDYHKSQLEVAKNTVHELQRQLDTIRLETSNVYQGVDVKLDYNNQVEKCQELQNVIFSKDKEIESLQINLAVSEESKRMYEEELKQKETELGNLLQNIPARTGESSPLAGELSSINPSSSNVPSRILNSPGMNPTDKNVTTALDQALYMLHERDVRCEELTLELTQLLEERDGLQLRLSNAIRTNEELRERLRQVLSSKSDDVNVGAIASLSGQEQYVSIPEQTTTVRPQLVQGTEGPTGDLQTKLTELRKIGYSHDKRLRDGSEYRHQQQMRLLSISPSTVSMGNMIEPTTSSDMNSIPAIVDISQSHSNDANPADQSSCVVM